MTAACRTLDVHRSTYYRWKAMVERNQHEMVDGLGLWGVPSFRLSGPAGEPDLAVWGQDRLWFIAAEIRRRASGATSTSR